MLKYTEQSTVYLFIYFVDGSPYSEIQRNSIDAFFKTAVLYAQYLTIIKYYDEQSVHLNRNTIKWPNGMSISFLIKILIYLSSWFIL